MNEDREQTQAIHQKQREAQTLEGLKARTRRTKIVRLHRNAQRLLKPVDVVIECLKERRFPDTMTRTRRDHMKFITLIQAITLLYQHQREIKTSIEEDVRLEYIEATEADVKLAWELASHVLMRSLDDVQTQARRLPSRTSLRCVCEAKNRIRGFGAKILHRIGCAIAAT